MKRKREKIYDAEVRLDLDTPRKDKLYALARSRGTSAAALLREAIDNMPEPRARERDESEAAE